TISDRLGSGSRSFSAGFAVTRFSLFDPPVCMVGIGAGAAPGRVAALFNMSGPATRGGIMEQRWGLPFIAWSSRLRPTRWDLVAVPLVLGGIMLFSWGGQEMSVPYKFGDALPISLDPSFLPEYALRTVLRMFLALIASLIFSLA